MPTPTALLLFFSSFCMLCGVIGRTPVPPPLGQVAPVGPGASSRAQDDSTARDLLAGAARFQLAGRPRPATSSFHGRFFVTVRGEDGNVTAEVERWYTRSPERIRTQRVESLTDSRQTVGSDGEQAWFRDDKTGQVIVYSDEPENFDVDIEQLEEQARITRLLLDALVLDALIPRLSEIRLGSVESVIDPDGVKHAAQHVSALVPDEVYKPPRGAPPPAPTDPLRMLELDFTIDVRTGALWALAVQPLGRLDVVGLEMRFAFHEPTVSGLRVPGNVRIYEQGAREETIQLGVEMNADDLLVLEIGGPVDEALFALPPGSGR